jgi:hypothetical protein
VNILLNNIPLRSSSSLRFFPTLRDAEDNTALHTAASAGALEVVQVLVGRAEGEDKKLFLELKNARGRTALHLAAFYGHFNVAEFLLVKVQVKIVLIHNTLYIVVTK